MPYLKNNSRLIKHLLTVSILTIFFLGSVLLLFLAVRNYVKSNRYNAIIIKYARYYSVDPNLIKAVIWKESNFNKGIVGAKGEIGLMQIIPSTSVHDWAVYNRRPIPPIGLIYSPEINIDIGTWYLAKCRNHWIKYKNSLALSLAEYNAGYTNAKKWAPTNIEDSVIDKIRFPSTREYVINILRKYE